MRKRKVLLAKILNQFSTEKMLQQWFTPRTYFLNDVIVESNIFVMTLPISGFAGFISLHWYCVESSLYGLLLLCISGLWGCVVYPFLYSEPVVVISLGSSLISVVNLLGVCKLVDACDIFRK